jgi:hypothetical protein
VATGQSGKLAGGSEVLYVATRDSSVARPCFRIFFAGDVRANAKLHRLDKQHAAYIAKIQFDASLAWATLAMRKGSYGSSSSFDSASAAAFAGAYGSSSRNDRSADREEGLADGGFRRRNGLSAPPDTSTRESVAPRGVELGLLVRATQRDADVDDGGVVALGSLATDILAVANGRSSTDAPKSSPLLPPRLRVMLPVPDSRTGALRCVWAWRFTHSQAATRSRTACTEGGWHRALRRLVLWRRGH